MTKRPVPEPVMLTVTEASILAGVSRTRAFVLTADGSWDSIKIGRTRRVYRASVLRWLREQGVEQGLDDPGQLD